MIYEEMPGVSLTPEQAQTVEMAARFVPPRLRCEFYRSLGDRIRGIRDLRSSDINHAAAACLQKYAPRYGERSGWVKQATR